MISPAPTVAALAELDLLAKTYATARGTLAGRVDALTEEVQAVYRRKMPGIKQALAEAKDAQAALAARVQAHPELFEKPRTMTLHGIKFGFKKGVGAIDWDCDDAVLVSRLQRMFAGDEAALELLVKVTKEPVKSALKDLDGAVLAKLGVTVEETGDYVIVKASDAEVDKLVKRILKEGAVEEAGEGAATA